jgi:chaperone required for assembly of F1-ATPase
VTILKVPALKSSDWQRSSKAVRETVMPNGEITDESIETAKEPKTKIFENVLSL